jgi:hypothetical protein
MVLLTDIDAFEQKAKELVRKYPKAARFTTKFRKSVPVLTLRLTNGRETYKMRIAKDSMVRQVQKMIASLMHLMASNELLA